MTYGTITTKEISSNEEKVQTRTLPGRFKGSRVLTQLEFTQFREDEQEEPNLKEKESDLSKVSIGDVGSK